MNTDNLTQTTTKTIEKLSKPEPLKELFRQHCDGAELPSGMVSKETTGLSCSILFPDYYGKSTVSTTFPKYHIGANTRSMHKRLKVMFMTGFYGMYPEYSRKNDIPQYHKPQIDNTAKTSAAKQTYIREIVSFGNDGIPNKDIPRHNIPENKIMVYSNATDSGRTMIGKRCVAGANIMVTTGMKPYTKKVARK